MDEGVALGCVDLRDSGQFWGFGPAMAESGGVGCVGAVEGDGALLTDLGGGAVAD